MFTSKRLNVEQMMRRLILKQLLASVIEATVVMMFTSTENANKAIIMTAEVEALEQVASDSA
jgi:hypothetical protein